jgi:hypothetical protein
LTSIVQVADRLTTPDPYHRYDLALDPLIEFWRERLQVFLVGVNSPKQTEPGGTTHD